LTAIGLPQVAKILAEAAEVLFHPTNYNALTLQMTETTTNRGRPPSAGIEPKEPIRIKPTPRKRG
jgi:hypothetical protein